MKTTYYVETHDGQLLNYFNKLRDAKDFGESGNKDFKIVKLVGPYKYEGRHDRILEFTNGKYRVVK